MTNYERIKNMSVEEMAEYFDNQIQYCDGCWLPYILCKKYNKGINCSRAWLEWLNQEVEK